MNSKIKTAILSSWSFTHMVIDFCCAANIYSIWFNHWLEVEVLSIGIILYNCLAFWLQILIWALCDTFKWSKSVGYLWCILVWLGVGLYAISPMIAIILVWIWNACFHVGWWITTLALSKWWASENWIFVAPWAIWLTAWLLCWKMGIFNPLIWIGLLIICLSLLLLSNKHYSAYQEIWKIKEINNWKEFLLPIFLLFFVFFTSIFIRSLVWFLINYSWKVWIPIVLWFTFAIALWKAFWWIIADRFWWMKIWIWSLILSLPFILIGEQIPAFWFIGIFLFNITMPIALVWMYQLSPKKPWIIFWLLCLALLLWALPYLLQVNFQNQETMLIIYFILLSAWCLWVGLKWIWKEKIE